MALAVGELLSTTEIVAGDRSRYFASDFRLAGGLEPFLSGPCLRDIIVLERLGSVCSPVGFRDPSSGQLGLQVDPLGISNLTILRNPGISSLANISREGV